jgi:hypothetical protein
MNILITPININDKVSKSKDLGEKLHYLMV